jgi:hypothetical protein
MRGVVERLLASEEGLYTIVSELQETLANPD